MIKVGLTGGIGSGKSSVGKFFEKRGIPVYDSDAEAKKLMVNSIKLKDKILDLFGEKAYNEDTLDRQYIATRVFRDKELLAKLNALVHPAVRKHFTQWMSAQEAPYVIQEAAILFENGAYREYDAMILVWAPKETRIQRIMKRDGTKREEIISRMKNQMPDTEKSALADFIIENIDWERTENQVEAIHKALMELAQK